MNLELIKGKKKYFKECVNALFDSKLGETYFKNREEAETSLQRIVRNEKWLIAIDDKTTFIGFICYHEKGVFNGFPYVHLFIIAKDVRNRGYGKNVLDTFEKTIKKTGRKLFLLVGDFNSPAKRFYEKQGYSQVGAIPGLYRNGVTECLMMKTFVG